MPNNLPILPIGANQPISNATPDIVSRVSVNGLTKSVNALAATDAPRSPL